MTNGPEPTTEQTDMAEEANASTPPSAGGDAIHRSRIARTGWTYTEVGLVHASNLQQRHVA